jgi:putative hydrolase of the HAD superfamily
MRDRQVQAVIFDLYGTLLRIRSPIVHRAIPYSLGIRARPWMGFVRDELLTRAFHGPRELVDHVRDRLAPRSDRAAVEACLQAIDRELASVETVEHAHSILGFLRRRGFKLGLLSNLTSLHKEPVKRLGLEQKFDVIGYSCDQGLVKPDRRLFSWISEALAVSPERVLVIGDSYPNDVIAAREAGMRAVWLDASDPRAALRELGQLATREIVPELPPLVEGSEPLSFGGVTGRLVLGPALPDGEQGRYNLVGRATLESRGPGVRGTDEEGRQDLFWKRCLSPEAAHVEAFVHALHGIAGLAHCEAAVLPGAEPLLLVSPAPGIKFHPPVDLRLAEELGRHCAAGYIFSNADLRPRNAFVERRDGGVVIRMLDLEHCLFNLAIDVDGLEDPLRPDTFDRLSAAEVASRTRHRVLSERAIRRAMGTFLQLDSLESPTARAFSRGWCRFFHDLQSRKEDICGRIEERAYTEPFLIVGTRAYRRAFARLDVEDIRMRIGQDPEELFPRLAAVRRGA